MRVVVDVSQDFKSFPGNAEKWIGIRAGIGIVQKLDGTKMQNLAFGMESF